MQGWPRVLHVDVPNNNDIDDQNDDDGEDADDDDSAADDDQNPDDNLNLKVRFRPPSPPPSPRILNNRPPGPKDIEQPTTWNKKY